MLRAKVYSVNMRPRRRLRTAARKKSYHHGNLREALVQAALARLEGNTQAEFSLRELARDVGVTVNATYRHFADKNAVLAAVAAQGFRQFTEHQVAAAAAGASDPRRAVAALGRAYIGFARQHAALFRLMFGRFDHSARDEELTTASQAAFVPLLNCVAETLNVPAQDPRALTTAVRAWGLVHGLSNLLLDRQLESFAVPVDELVTGAMEAISF